jgi:hypothetical protein
MAQTGAWQLQRTDVRVNAVCPGLIETGMTAGTFDYARARGNGARIGQLNPMGRYGVAEGACAFFCVSPCAARRRTSAGANDAPHRNRQRRAVPRVRSVLSFHAATSAGSPRRAQTTRATSTGRAGPSTAA